MHTETLQTTFRKMKPNLADQHRADFILALCGSRDPRILAKEVLLTTGAKAYYLGGGWWRLSGYAADGSDIKRIYQSL